MALSSIVKTIFSNLQMDFDRMGFMMLVERMNRMRRDMKVHAKDFIQIVTTAHIDGSEAELEAKIASMLTRFSSELTGLEDFNRQANKTTTQLFDEISSQEREAEKLRRNVQELERTICEVQRTIESSKEAQNEAERKRDAEQRKLNDLRAENERRDEESAAALIAGNVIGGAGVVLGIAGLLFPPLEIVAIPMLVGGAGGTAAGLTGAAVNQLMKTSEENLAEHERTVEFHNNRVDSFRSMLSQQMTELFNRKLDMNAAEKKREEAKQKKAECEKFQSETLQWEELLRTWIKFLDELHTALQRVQTNLALPRTLRRSIDYYGNVIARFENENGWALQSTRTLALEY